MHSVYIDTNDIADDICDIPDTYYDVDTCNEHLHGI